MTQDGTAAAVDGKALRGARTGDGGRVFLLGAISHGTGVVLGQRQIPDKKGEADQVEALLAPLDTAGMVFTLDALHTTRKTARLITDDLDAHYLLIVKGSQLCWFTSAGTPMTATDWQDPGAQSLTLYLDGADAPDRAADGGELLDDDFLVLVNAWWEPLQFTVPATRTGQVWLAEIDTFDPGRVDPATKLGAPDAESVGPRAVVAFRRPLAG